MKYWDMFLGMVSRPRDYVFNEGKNVTLLDAVIYVAIIGAIVGFISGLLGSAALAMFGMESGTGPILGLIWGAIGAVIGLFIGGLIIYVILLIVGAGGVDLTKVFVASGLSYTGNIASIIPVIGGIIALIWELYLLYLALIGVADVPPDKSRLVIIILVVIGLILALLGVLIMGAAMSAVMSGM